MYSAYKVELENCAFKEYASAGLNESCATKTKFAECFSNTIMNKVSIDAIDASSRWFPSINADVFISHSHNDLTQAHGVAGYLKTELGLNCFIDADAWEYMPRLEENIAKELESLNNGITIDDGARQKIATNLTLLLSSSLLHMIDQTECFLFLETPNSVTSKSRKLIETDSPWIYSELLFSQKLQRKIPQRRSSLDEDFTIKFNFKIEPHSMQQLDVILLKYAKKLYDKSNIAFKNGLDFIYTSCPPTQATH